VPERYRGPIQWVAGQLTDDDAAWIRGWNDTTTLVRGALGKVLFCHATPRSDVELFTARSPDERVQTMLDGVDARIVVCGHTHMQFDRRVGQWRVVNAGSVGMPFGERGAYWAIVGSDVELRRTEYDYEKAAARIRATAFPTAEEFAANNVLSPPSAETMVAAFERR
jgi:predicted phosphodiesterase